MKIHKRLLPFLALLMGAHAHLSGQSATNLGLVGVGRLSSAEFDRRGPGIDSLGGIGSGIHFDPQSWARFEDPEGGYSYSGTLFSSPDRGFGDGTQALHPRLQTFQFTITPYYGNTTALQNQIVLSNSATSLFSYEGNKLFTGFDPDSLSQTDFPTSSPDSIGEGLRSLDPEGLAPASDGGWFVCDEYGPFVYKFSAAGALEYSMRPPEAILPRRGNYPGAIAFTATNAPTSGRRNNRGLEGLSLTPDGKRLFSLLQSPTIQDVGGGNLGRNTRLLVFDVDPVSPTFRQAIAEYIYRLTLNATPETNRNTPASEILALNRTQFLVLERDSLGLGNTVNTAPLYKQIVLGDLSTATNIINTAYDLERGAPGQLSLPADTLPPGLAAVTREDLIDLIDTNQLGRFGLNISTNQDQNTLSEKWEGLTLMPLHDEAAPHDYLLLIANDNDFKSPVIYHNGTAVGTNQNALDNMVLAYRVSLPTYGSPTPPNQFPGVVFTGPTNATLSAPARVNLTTTAYDQDGKVVRVEFFENSVKIGEATSFPHQLTLDGVTVGTHEYTAVATDNEGATATASKTVVVTELNLPAAVTLAGPKNPTLSAPATVLLTATAIDPDGSVSKVEFFEAGVKLGQDLTPPYSWTASNVTSGLRVFTAVATDNQGRANSSAEFSVNVTTENLAPTVSLLTPTNGFTSSQPLNLSFSATAADPDGSIVKVEYYRGATRLGQATASPYALVVSNFVAGTSAVHALAYDNQGATTASASHEIVVQDRIGPALTCPSDITVACSNPNGTPVTFVVTALDNTDGPVNVTCVPPSGSLFMSGVTTVTCIARDAAGNTSSCTFKVTVNSSSLTIEQAVVLRWSCGEILQAAQSLEGPWEDLSTAISPHTVLATDAKKFYRLRR
jgi:hypothetical protein